MGAQRHSIPRRHLALQGPVAAAMLLLFLLLHVVAASQFLHSQVCDDAAADDHHCAVSVFAQGSLDVPPGQPALTRPETPILVRTAAPAFFTASVVSLLPPGRAPPSLPA